VLVSSQGALVASAARAIATRRAGDAAEQDAEALWRAVKASIAEAAALAPAAAADVVAIGCCSQYSSIVPVGADAAPVADMVLWQDRRGADHILRSSATSRISLPPDRTSRTASARNSGG
jgi:xylulokinase